MDIITAVLYTEVRFITLLLVIWLVWELAKL